WLMISHEHRCILIHIPRCAGTSIERWICGADWWTIEPETKHLLASQARLLYREHWDHYFKFSVVRAPIDRMISCAKYGEHFGVSIDGDNRMSLARYHERFGHDVVVEFEYRYYKREQVITPRHGPGKVYGNTLDEELDFIARYENLENDIKVIGEAIKLPVPEPFNRLELSDERVDG